ncbi:MAG: hypothetical protein M1417_00525 [Candidatus Thermoplasmatota archaeon]|uniref:Signal peptidase I n=3 Tax=Candidatus Sysuiplasma superficiale TaxID=2823368 RepID=A0A8J8CFR9_9ARCH|nr:hypothetical protein [Candidatus Sysuiplasma superficiale]MCL4347428.1 hypothetical protein [Candidatus Thermoplasmatota archaeon]MCL5437173.1 hypothetical protein [Candidatus Thermoplasmatota archaeon]
MDPGEKTQLRDFVVSISAAALIALLIIGGLYVYAGNWPPMVVVESGSMQHSSTYAYLGDLNIGDMVVVKRVSSVSQIVTYVQGAESHFSTYGEFGNVIIYKPYGSSNVVPIIHRAIVYIQYNKTGGGYNIPSLAGLNDSEWFVMTPSGPEHYVNNIMYNVELTNVGYTHTPVIIPVKQMIRSARFSGFITMGDHNHAAYGENATDQALGIFPLPVKIQWVEGIAVGLLPYVGLIKLYFDGGIPAETPQNSVVALVVIIVAVAATIFSAEYILETLRRRKEGEGDQENRESD